MRFTDVFGDDVAIPLVNSLLASDDADSFSTACGIGLHDIHVFVLASFSIVHPALVIFGKDVSGRGDVEGFAVKPPQSLNISPHAVLPSDGPWACEVVQVLVLPDVAQTILSEQSCPANIVICSCHMPETCHFQCINYTIICMSRFRNFKSRRAERLQLVLRILYNPRKVFWKLSLRAQEGRVRKKNIGLMGRERAFYQRNELIRWSFKKFFSDREFTLFFCHAFRDNLFLDFSREVFCWGFFTGVLRLHFGFRCWFRGSSKLLFLNFIDWISLINFWQLLHYFAGSSFSISRCSKLFFWWLNHPIRLLRLAWNIASSVRWG